MVRIQMAKHSLKWLFSLASRGEGLPVLSPFSPSDKKKKKKSKRGFKFGVLYFILIKQTYPWKCGKDIIYFKVIMKCENYTNFHFFRGSRPINNNFGDGFDTGNIFLKKFSEKTECHCAAIFFFFF